MKKQQNMTAIRGNKKWYHKYIENYDLCLLALVGLIALIVFAYLPMGGILVAFKDYKIRKGILASDWVGFRYFIEMFSGADFPRALRNTFMISGLKILFGFPAPILLAIILNECLFTKFKKVVQTCSYLPHFFSWIILSSIIKQIFAPKGVINFILNGIGIKQPILFFSNSFWFIVMIVITSIWKEIGWGSIIYLAAITGIDPSLYEAAELDGASKLQQIRYVTLPSIMPTIVTMFILRLATVLNLGIDQIYALYNPMVYEHADILDTYLLRTLQSANYGFGTAVGLFKSIVNMAFVLLGNAFVKKATGGEQGII